MELVSNLKKDFAVACTRTKDIPDMQVWTPIIRNVIPKKAVYVFGYKYVDDAGSDQDAFILLDHEINWPNSKNDPDFRSKYFHKSKYDSNIWILEKDHRYDGNVIKSLIKIPSLIKHLSYLHDRCFIKKK